MASQTLTFSCRNNGTQYQFQIPAHASNVVTKIRLRGINVNLNNTTTDITGPVNGSTPVTSWATLLTHLPLGATITSAMARRGYQIHDSSGAIREFLVSGTQATISSTDTVYARTSFVSSTSANSYLYVNGSIFDSSLASSSSGYTGGVSPVVSFSALRYNLITNNPSVTYNGSTLISYNGTLGNGASTADTTFTTPIGAHTLTCNVTGGVDVIVTITYDVTYIKPGYRILWESPDAYRVNQYGNSLAQRNCRPFYCVRESNNQLYIGLEIYSTEVVDFVHVDTPVANCRDRYGTSLASPSIDIAASETVPGLRLLYMYPISSTVRSFSFTGSRTLTSSTGLFIFNSATIDTYIHIDWVHIGRTVYSVVANIDTAITSASPTSSSGGTATTINIGGTNAAGTTFVYGLLRFNMPAQVAGKTITRALLSMVMSSFAQLVEVQMSSYQVTSNWTQSTTYNTRPSFSPTVWAVSDYIRNSRGRYNMDITALTQAWNNQSITNYGVLLTNNVVSGVKSFYSSETASVDYRPTLFIEIIPFNPLTVVTIPNLGRNSKDILSYLRVKVNEFRALNWLPDISWTDTVSTGNRIRAIHWNELQSAILEVYTYTSQSLTPVVLSKLQQVVVANDYVNFPLTDLASRQDNIVRALKNI